MKEEDNCVLTFTGSKMSRALSVKLKRMKNKSLLTNVIDTDA